MASLAPVPSPGVFFVHTERVTSLVTASLSAFVGVTPRIRITKVLGLSGGGASVTTYYFIKIDGNRGTTTDKASIPVGAVVYRRSVA